MMRIDSSSDDGDDLIYVESLDQEGHAADFAKVTVKSYDMLLPAAHTSSDEQKPRIGWVGSRPSSAKSQVQTSPSRPPSRARKIETFTTHGSAAKILYPRDKTRPRFLVDILHYLKAELKELGADSVAAGDMRRLQVYRDIFERFISEFKTYEPLLSEIKHEYEMAIQHQRETLEKLYPVQRDLAIHRHRAAQEMDEIREEARGMLQQLTSENQELGRNCALLKSELESSRHQYGKVTEELQRRDARNEEYVSNKTAEIRGELQALERSNQEQLRKKDEQITELQKGLRRAHEDMGSMVDAMNILKATYVDSVTREMYDDAISERDDARRESEQRAKDAEKLSEVQVKLEEQIKTLERALQREEENKYPDWDYIQSMSPGSVQQWDMLCKDRDYNDSIVLLIREIIKARTIKAEAKREKEDDRPRQFGDSEPRFFVGLGLSAAVPKYLRFKGKIRNRRLSRRNLCLLIRDIWSAKAEYDARPTSKTRMMLADFFYAYLRKRFATQENIAIWAYNIYEACKNHRFQSVECQLFYDVLTGELDEQVYHHQSRMIERLKNVFYRLDVDLHEGKARGIVSKEDAMSGLRRYWPDKSDKHFEQLRNALDADQPGTNMTYRWLFQSEVECMFLDIVREQEMEMREAYITGLADLLGSSIRLEANTARNKEAAQTFRLTVLDFSRALSRFDPTKPRADVDEMMRRGFGVKSEELKLRSSIEVSKFLKNISRGIVCKGPLRDVEK